VALPQGGDGLGHRALIRHVAGLDHSRRERHLGEATKHGCPLAGVDDGSTHRIRTYVETYRDGHALPRVRVARAM